MPPSSGPGRVVEFQGYYYAYVSTGLFRRCIACNDVSLLERIAHAAATGHEPEEWQRIWVLPAGVICWEGLNRLPVRGGPTPKGRVAARQP